MTRPLASIALALLLPCLAHADDVRVSDRPLVDQDGRKVKLTELFADKTVVVSFAFTTCTTICSPMTAVLGKLQNELGSRLDREVRLVTLSLDPRTDTPERLAEYARKFDRRQGWTFVTGPLADVRDAAEGLGGWVAKKERHAPLLLVGNASTGRWKRVHGLQAPNRILDVVNEVSAPSFAGPEADRAAEAWFTNTVLVDQHGKSHRFYADLIRGKKVMINFAFASCTTACSPITANLAKVQQLLGDEVGRSIHMITITVDPTRDRPERLRAFGEKFGVGEGWYFLSGDVASVEAVLRKLGGYTEVPEAHLTSVLIGDTASGNWVKALGMSRPELLAEAVERIDDP